MKEQKIITVRVDTSDYEEALQKLTLLGITPEQAIKQFVKDIAGGSMIGYMDALNTQLWKQKQEEQKGYSLSEVCEVLHISQRTAYRYIEAGKIKAEKEGKLYSVTEEELNRLLQEAKFSL